MYSRAGIAIRPEVRCRRNRVRRFDFTGRIEQLINELKQDLLTVYVTTSCRSRLRVVPDTAFMYLGELLEFGNTDDLFISWNRRHDTHAMGQSNL